MMWTQDKVIVRCHLGSVNENKIPAAENIRNEIVLTSYEQNELH